MTVDRWSDNVGTKIYGNQNTKCRMCNNNIWDELGDKEKWKANLDCKKYKGKPMTTFKDDKDFYCKYFEQKD